MHRYILLPMIALLVVPFFADAQSLGWFNTIATELENIVGTLISVAVAAAFLVFVWGLIKFILAAGDDEGRKAGKQVMIWGIVALFVIVSVWGIVTLLGTILNITPGTDAQDVSIPTVR